MASRPFVARETRLVAYVKQVVLSDRKGLPFTKIVLEVDLPKWVDRSSLAKFQATLADVYLVTIPMEQAEELVLDPEEAKAKMARMGAQQPQ